MAQEQESTGLDITEHNIGSKSYEELMSEITEETEKTEGTEGTEKKEEETTEETTEETEEEGSVSKEFAEKMRVESAVRKEAEKYRHQAEQLQQQLAQVQPLLQAAQQKDGGLAVLQALGIDPQDTVQSMIGGEKEAPKVEDEIQALKTQLQQMVEQQQQQQNDAILNTYTENVAASLKDESEEIKYFYDLCGYDFPDRIQEVWRHYSENYGKSLQPAELAGILKDEVSNGLKDPAFLKEFQTRYERMNNLYTKLFPSTSQSGQPEATADKKQPQAIQAGSPTTGGDAFAGRDTISSEEMARQIKQQFFSS